MLNSVLFNVIILLLIVLFNVDNLVKQAVFCLMWVIFLNTYGFV